MLFGYWVPNPYLKKNPKPKDKLLGFWFNRLWEMAISAFKIDGDEFYGVNATMNDRFLLSKLFQFGYAGIAKDTEGKLRGLNCVAIGMDPYMFPKNLGFHNHALGDYDRTVNETCVFMPCNKYCEPIISKICKYAEQLANIDLTLDVNVQNIRTTKVFIANNDGEGQQIRRMMEDVENGLPATLIKSSLRDSIIGSKGNSLPAYTFSEQYFADKMIQDVRSKIAEFLNMFGVDSSGANQLKGERNLVDEVHSNDQEVAVNRAFWIDPMQEAFDKCKELWGVNWKIDIVGRDEIESRMATAQSIADSSEFSPES